MSNEQEEEENRTDIDIMSYINKDKLNLINDAFNKLGMGLTLDEFLRIMLHFADISTEKEKINYVEKLIDAFKQIDVNGDETLEWDEFSNFIVETGISKQKSNFVDVIRNYHLSTVLWDNGKWDVTDTGEIIGELHRDEIKWHNDELIQTYIKASQTEFGKDLKIK